ncbi:MAG: N-acyl homoserine lactonase family protein [Xanthobacteraceae bacterium]|nr:N-acyl homoserine lactonase family protein [Xanthobacteraceae bacterium]
MVGLRSFRMALAGCAVLFSQTLAFAAAPEGTKLYIFSSGWLNLEKSLVQSTATNDRIKVPVSFYVIKHPKGVVLFETGNNDRIITDPTYWGPFIQGIQPDRNPEVAIDLQLAKIGLKPNDINYVIISHLHLDHAGNVSKFPNATLVYQRDEVVNAFWPKPGTAGSYITGDFEALRAPLGAPNASRQPVIELDGDLDLFGDGSIYLHRAAGHTPGTQLALVRLPKTGLVILTSDTLHLKENLDKNVLPSLGLVYDPVAYYNGYSYIRRIRDLEHGDVLPTHDAEAFNAHKHAPEYYE